MSHSVHFKHAVCIGMGLVFCPYNIQLISDDRNRHYLRIPNGTYKLEHMYCVCAHRMNVRNLHLIGWLLKMSLINWGLSEIDEGKDNE